MDRKVVLFELMDTNDWYIHDLLEKGDREMLYWTPDGRGNSISVTIWHAARALDVFLHQHVLGGGAESELWFASGWAERTGYDPRGIGTHGWGMLTGYSEEEVQAVPRFETAVLRGYYDEVLGAVRGYLRETADEALNEMAPGYEGKQTFYFWVRHPIFDLTRHVGEILALKALWERGQE
ncbi:MAG: DinB family protein [Candidatus Promineifilaceae bacterium]|nr:DinB family protein [Candidatus Promineifilaceae bacterium]